MKTITHAKTTSKTAEFIKSDDGSMTILGILLFATMAMIAAIAVDVTNLVAAKSQLQITADAAAHAALYYRDTHEATESKVMAVDVATSGMPEGVYGVVLKPEDIIFGRWDYDTQVFTIDNTSRKAVMVKTGRISERSNSVASYLFQLVGKTDWDVVTPAVFATFRPMCFREGFVSDGVVDIQSNNGFENGFCVHSNEYVSLNSNNTFEPGTVVSMPDTDDIDLPRSGYETNDGLRAALRSGVYRLRILNKMDDLFEGLLTGDPEYIPDYITDTTVINIPPPTNSLKSSDLEPGHVYRLNCNQSGKLTLESGETPFSEVVLITSCEVKFSAGAVLEDVVMANTNTSARSFNAPSSLQLGRDDNCAEGGGVELLTYGSMIFAADLKMFGAQLLAQGDVTFAANATGIQGAQIVARGEISGTSNMTMGFCGSGMESNFEAEYFRLAR